MNLDIQCVEVSTARNTAGYGHGIVTIGKNHVLHLYAHIIAFEKAWGVRVPAGMVVRHTCDNPSCVNPLHLQLGTQRQNMEDMRRRGRARNQYKDATHCLKGHEFDESNTYIHPKRGTRHCKACQRVRRQAWLT
jgi:hypothetical protein